MRTTAGALYEKQDATLTATPSPALREVGDRKYGFGLLFWALAIVAQALLCIWMIVQASNPPLP